MSEFFKEKITVNEILEEICEEENEEYSKLRCPPWLNFSFKHRKAMKKILSPTAEENPQERISRSNIPPRKRAAVFLLSVILALFVVTGGAYTINRFSIKERSDNIELFINNWKNAPETIEEYYQISQIPDEYQLSEQITDNWDCFTSYTDPNTNRTLMLRQSVKEGYAIHFDVDYHILEETMVNTRYGYYMNLGGESDCGIIIWDGEDYVFELFGDFNKKELLDLAKTLIIKK